MSHEIQVRVPDIGDFDDVPVIEILVAEGEAVEPEQSLVTLESDKATMEVPAPTAGTVQSLAVALGDTVSEGDLIATLLADEVVAKPQEAAPETRPEPSQPEPSPPKHSAPPQSAPAAAAPAALRMKLAAARGLGSAGRVTQVRDQFSYLRTSVHEYMPFYIDTSVRLYT